MSLKENIEKDIYRVFMNTSEYADDLTIQIGTEKFYVKGSLQKNTVENNSGNGSPLQAVAWVLYIPYPITGHDTITLFSDGTRITVNGDPYTVTSVSDEMGVAEVQLKAGRGR